MACEYCRDKLTKEILHDRTCVSLKGAKFPGIEVFIDEDELTVIAVADTYEPNYQEVVVQINFCPMCGRELKSKEETT